jgi:hypothetical protein
MMSHAVPPEISSKIPPRIMMSEQNLNDDGYHPSISVDVVSIVRLHNLLGLRTYHELASHQLRVRNAALPSYRPPAQIFVLLGYNFRLLSVSYCANALHNAGRRFKPTDFRSIVDAGLQSLLGSRNLKGGQSFMPSGSESLSTTVRAFNFRLVSIWCFKDKYVVILNSDGEPSASRMEPSVKSRLSLRDQLPT